MAELSTSFRLQLPRRLYAEMIAQASAELPNECCGLLAGTPDGRVVRRYPLRNVAPAPTREYWSDGKDMCAANRDMRTSAIDTLAIYHSHPSSEPVPSKKDLERNYYGNTVVHFIISLMGKVPEVRGWRLTSEGATEEGWDWSEEG
jgi:proteasome lid subunit RPN8/RPN11